MPQPTEPVNVASVPQRSPFRYPGGKTWLVPHIRRWLKSLSKKPRRLIEPFAGGGIVSLTAAFEDLADEVVMVELDDAVAAVRRVVLSDDASALADAIMAFNMTRDNVMAVLECQPDDLLAKAFQTILKNRVFHEGIMAHGSGLIKHGENGKGLRSRWYPRTLYRRIMDIASIRRRIVFIEGDGMPVIQDQGPGHDTVFFIDPPYTAGGKRAGSRLYRHCDIEHERLFDMVAGVECDFLMTYDEAEGVMALALHHGFATKTVPMRNTHHATVSELLIGRDLGWVIQSHPKAALQGQLAL